MTRLADPETIEFEAMYKKALRGRFGNILVVDTDELGFCKELVEQAERGDVPHSGEMHHVVPTSLDYTHETMAAAITGSALMPTVHGSQALRLPQLALLIALALAFVTYVVMTLTAVNKPSIGSATSVISTIPTYASASGAAGTASTATLTPLPAPTVPAGFVTVAGERLPSVWPTTLELGGRSFLVYVAPVRDGNWLVRQEPGIANWVPGSTINWSFALYVNIGSGSDTDSSEWLARLQTNTGAVLRISDGRARRFRIQDRREINRAQTEFLDPHRPGLTVVIKYKPGDTRLLLRGTELSDRGANSGEEVPSVTVPEGTPATSATPGSLPSQSPVLPGP